MYSIFTAIILIKKITIMIWNFFIHNNTVVMVFLATRSIPGQHPNPQRPVFVINASPTSKNQMMI